jgi:CBS domain containing-hemolysin-like protein
VLIINGLLIAVVKAATASFVAREFATADSGMPRQPADAGESAAPRALGATGRLPLMLSSAQLRLAVTALPAGHAAEPIRGKGPTAAFGTAGLTPAATSQEPLARALSPSTLICDEVDPVVETSVTP